MNERDKWLDERIRRGVTAWNPVMPAHLDEEIQKRVNAIGDGEPRGRKRIGRLPGVATAAAILAGAVLLWTGLPKAPEPLPVVTGLPKTRIAYQSPPTMEITLPEPFPVGKPARRPSALPERTETSVRPKQVDLMLSIPDKNITIVWCQREDFDLLDETEPKK